MRTATTLLLAGVCLSLPGLGCVDFRSNAETSRDGNTEDAGDTRGGGNERPAGTDPAGGRDAAATAPDAAGGSNAADAPVPPADAAIVVDMDPGPPSGRRDGQACTSTGQCGSGFCVDGVCCQGACNQSCHACNVAGSPGKCTPIPDGQDPGDECLPEPPSTCARDGACNGRGGCRLHDQSTICVVGSCQGDTEASPRLCDGLGTCQPAAVRSCTPGTCNGNTCGSPPGVNLAMGLISRWKLDEGMGNTTADSGGSGNTGTISGATWILPGAPGTKYPNPAALHFDGNDDYVELGNRNMRANNQAQSIAFWVAYTAAPSGARLCVSISQGDGGEARLKVGFNEGQARAWKSSSDPLVSTAIPAAGWHHMAYTFDGTIHRLYLDGTIRAMSGVAPDNGPPTNVRIGALHNNAENFLGDIDEVRIYSRALNAAEVTALAQGLE